MRSLMRYFFLVALACAAPAGAQAPEPLTRDSFAYGIELRATPGLPVQTVLVPLAVYRAALQPDLGDVRVFNAAGALLPHALRKLDGQDVLDQPIAEREQRVPLFPLFAPEDASAAAIDALALRIERGAGGSIIDIRSQAAADAGAEGPTRVVAYVLDTQAIDRDMLSLRIELDEPAESAETSYLATLAIDVSDDLSSWRTVVPDGVVARLSHAGRLVTRNRLDLSGVRADFIRARWSRLDLPGRISDAWIEVTQGQAPARARERLRLVGTASAAEAGVYDYDLGGAFPVERVRVILPAAGTLIQAELSVAAAQGDREPVGKTSAIRARTSKRIYDDVYRGPIYRLQEEGRELESPPIELDGHRVRYVSMTVGEHALLAEPPSSRSVPAGQLLFVAATCAV